MARLRSSIVFTATLQSLARLTRKYASPALLVANFFAGLLLFDLGSLSFGGPGAVSIRGRKSNDGITTTTLFSGSSRLGGLHRCSHAGNALTVARFTEYFEKFFRHDTAGERRLWGIKERKSKTHMAVSDWPNGSAGLRRHRRHMQIGRRGFILIVAGYIRLLAMPNSNFGDAGFWS
jgi:hypothetical protein